jgi:hypothetical protein
MGVSVPAVCAIPFVNESRIARCRLAFRLQEMPSVSGLRMIVGLVARLVVAFMQPL